MDLNMKIVLSNITKQALIKDFERFCMVKGYELKKENGLEPVYSWCFRTFLFKMIEEITWETNIKYRADFRVSAGPDGGYGQSYYIS